LSDGNQWSYTWVDLAEKAKGETIRYTVKEVSDVPGYTSEVEDSNLGNVTITNTHTPIAPQNTHLNKSITSELSNIKSKKNILLKTGEKIDFWLIILGICLIFGSSYFYFRKK
ncbi:TPA: Cna B-type domain-containing protein, partial [Enterococcus faecalis]|nr:Cna B-type domain-containing protein [Enterococcus faecalis]